MEFQETLALARSGDAEATEQLFASYYPRVQSIVHRTMAQELRVNRPWLVPMFSTGDVVQEVFQGVLRDLEEFDGPNEASFVAFLATLVRNRIVDAVRFHEALRRDPRRSARDVDVDGTPATGPTSPAEIAELNDEVQLVANVLQSFPSRERLLLQQRLDGASTFAVLAEQLGYPSEDAARKAYYTAQARLLMKLRAAGLGGD